MLPIQLQAKAAIFPRF